MDLPTVTGTNNPNRQVSVDAWNNAVVAINDSGKKSEANTWTGATQTWTGQQYYQGRINFSVSGAPGSFATVGAQFQATNTSTTAGYGYRFYYKQEGEVTSGFTLVSANLGDFTGLNGSATGMSDWLVAQSGTDATKTFGVCGVEINPINLADDKGYARNRIELNRWLGGIQIVPEAHDLLTGGANYAAYNVLFGVMISHSNSDTSSGYQAKTYNGILCETDAIAPGGVGVQLAGANADPTQIPKFGVRVDDTWETALDTRGGTFTNSDRAITLKQGQKLAWYQSDGTTLRREFNEQTIVSSAPVPVLRYLLPEQVGAIAGAHVAGGENSLRFFMGYLRRDITIDALGLRITTAVAGGNMQIGIWAADATTAFPTGAPLVTSASLSTGSAAAVTDTAATGSLKAGWYWFATNADTTAATAVAMCFGNVSTQMLSLVGQGTISTGVVVGLAKSQTFGTWPTLTGNATTDGLSVVSTASIPAVFYMAA